MPQITGFSHVDLSVSNLDRSEEWYRNVLGAKRILAHRVDDAGYEFRVMVEPASMTLFALFQHDGNTGTNFDVHRSGLDHVALAVADEAALNAWKAHLDSLGVTNAGIENDPYSSAIVAKDPDGIPVEFYYFAAADKLPALLAG